MSKYYQVLISAENKAQASSILNALLNKKLIIGGTLLQGPATFWWKGKINRMEEYSYLLTYTVEKNKQSIIEETKNVAVEEVPMISFIAFEGNEELLRYIDSVLS
ncbi:MAG TPA: divalent cation tolerance protein CutA [Vitreimonas sp.]|nr:divalent cation tolerance protein CutA [Vitreimonas sp.]